MCELMGKSAQHCVFCQISNIVLAVEACVDVDVNGAGFASFESALGALEISTCIHFRLIQHNVNAGSFRIGGQNLIGNVLIVVEGLFQVFNGNPFPLHNAGFPSILTVCLCQIVRFQIPRCGIGCCRPCFVGKLNLLVRQNRTNTFQILYHIQSDGTALGIVKYTLKGRIKLLYILITADIVDLFHIVGLGTVLLGNLINGHRLIRRLFQILNRARYRLRSIGDSIRFYHRKLRGIFRCSRYRWRILLVDFCLLEVIRIHRTICDSLDDVGIVICWGKLIG